MHLGYFTDIRDDAPGGAVGRVGGQPGDLDGPDSHDAARCIRPAPSWRKRDGDLCRRGPPGVHLHGRRQGGPGADQAWRLHLRPALRAPHRVERALRRRGSRRHRSVHARGDSREPREAVVAVKAGLGGAVKRREDVRLITGTGQYTDDVRRDGALYAVFVRSTFAHARVLKVDVSAAAAMPGVVGVFVAADLGLKTRAAFPAPDSMARPPPAEGVARL